MATPATPPAKASSYPSPSLVVNGIACSVPIEDLGDGALVESWGPDGPTATLMLKCAYADRYSVIRGLRAGSTVAGKGWTYTAPLRYPPSPNLMVTSIGEIRGLRPWTDHTGWPQYDHAIIPVTFSVPTWGAVDQPPADASGLAMTSTKFKGSAAVVSPPTGSYLYTGGASVGKPVPESSLGIIQARAEISMTRHQVPFPYVDGPLWLVGSVNDEVVTFGDRTFARGTILCATFDADFQPNEATGDPAWDFTFSLLANDNQEWNEVIDPGGLYVLVNTAADGTGETPFPYKDFSLLFSLDFQPPPGD